MLFMPLPMMHCRASAHTRVLGEKETERQSVRGQMSFGYVLPNLLLRFKIFVTKHNHKHIYTQTDDTVLLFFHEDFFISVHFII